MVKKMMMREVFFKFMFMFNVVSMLVGILGLDFLG